MGLIRGIFKIFETIYNEGEKEWLDESKYMEMLKELYEKFESGEIDDNEYEELEGEIIDRLREIKNYKRDHGIEED